MVLSDHPLVASLTLREVLRRTRRRVALGPIHRLRFAGLTSTSLAAAPINLRRGDPLIARSIYAGLYHFAGRLAEPGPRSIFEIVPPTPAFAAELCGFTWLRHHVEAGDELSLANARAHIIDFLSHRNPRLAGPAFRPEVAAERLIAWLTFAEPLTRSAGPAFTRRLLASLDLHTRYLRIAALETADGMPRLLVRIALAFAALCLSSMRGRIAVASTRLSREIERQVHPDGGHISRDPSVLLRLLPDLIALKECYRTCGHAAPRALCSAVDRMLPALRFFRGSDGSLALFNGVGETDMQATAMLLRHDESTGAPASRAPQSGFRRLACGPTVVIADTGTPPPSAVSGSAHAGTLSFELSSGTSRIVVNCGRPMPEKGNLRRLARSTAAHSTVTIGDRSSSRFAGARSLDRFLGSPLLPGPSRVDLEDDEDGGGFSARHDGYARCYQALHRRTLGLSADGLRLDGWDGFETTPNTPLDTAVARFHLHPSVQIAQGIHGIRLTTRDGCWLFQATRDAEIEESIYFAESGGPRRTFQIVVTFDVRDHLGVAWRFTRES